MYLPWIRAEQFYTFIMPLVIIVLLFLTIAFVFAYTYTDTNKKSRKYLSRGYFVLIGLSVIYFVFGHLTYNYWIEQNDYINPGIRSSQTILGIETSEDPSIVKTYRHSGSLKENLKALKMYESKKVSIPFSYDYAGSNENNHYFTYGKDSQYVFILQGKINWTKNKRELVGFEFSLTDERFKDIGFYNEPNIIFDSLSLPESEQRALADIEVNDALSINEMISGWNFGRQFY